MRAAFFTLGCKVNQYETDVLKQLFAAAGFDIVDPADDTADVYVINSCTVTATGDQKSRQALRRFRRKNPGAVLCLTGCFPQAYPDAAQRLPEADIITGTGNRHAILPAVRARLAGGARTVDVLPHQKGQAFEKMRLQGSIARTRAFVKIQDGCARRCAYCIIPTARGPLRSKPLAELTQELLELAGAGYREVVLVGINLSCYGKDLGGTLLDALAAACAVPGIERVRLGSLEPEQLSADTIAALAALPKLCPQFHLSLQSGCDATLARMRRQYRTQDYLQMVQNLRAAFPNCAITTDMMVGFPGEDPAEFAQSLFFAGEIEFAQMHVFAYSARPGTPAAAMCGQLPAEEKRRRSGEMTALAQRSRDAFLRAQLGRPLRVLLETPVPGGWEGYSENYTPVRVQTTAPLRSGSIIAVYPDRILGGHCVADYALSL